MEAPKVEEAVKEQIRREYDEFNLDELLNGSNQSEESKEIYDIGTSKKQLYSLFS
jgi:hypothetical protein